MQGIIVAHNGAMRLLLQVPVCHIASQLFLVILHMRPLLRHLMYSFTVCVVWMSLNQRLEVQLIGHIQAEKTLKVYDLKPQTVNH